MILHWFIFSSLFSFSINHTNVHRERELISFVVDLSFFFFWINENFSYSPWFREKEEEEEEDEDKSLLLMISLN